MGPNIHLYIFAIVLAIKGLKIVSIVALVGLHIEDVEFSNNGFGLYSILGPLVLGFVSILLTFGPHTHTHLLIHICFPDTSHVPG